MDSASTLTPLIIIIRKEDELNWTEIHLPVTFVSSANFRIDVVQLILQPFCHFTYVTGTSPTSLGEPPMCLINCYDCPPALKSTAPITYANFV